MLASPPTCVISYRDNPRPLVAVLLAAVAVVVNLPVWVLPPMAMPHLRTYLKSNFFIVLCTESV